MLHVGIVYRGNTTESTGFCINRPEHAIHVTPPKTCSLLETCCAVNVNHPALYEACLIDFSGACCDESEENSLCCEPESKCDGTYFCSEGETCDHASYTCSISKGKSIVNLFFTIFDS